MNTRTAVIVGAVVCVVGGSGLAIGIATDSDVLIATGIVALVLGVVALAVVVVATLRMIVERTYFFWGARDSENSITPNATPSGATGT